MSRRLRPAALPAALFAAAAGLSAFTILRGYSPHDEGLMLEWAARVAHGQWPYRDFWSNYAPGQTVVLAGLTKLFGPSLLTWRIYRVALDATIALLAYALVRRSASRPVALLAWLAVAGAMAFPTGPGPNPPALALGLGALLLARRSPVGAGALAGLAVVFRPEIGGACALGAALPSGVGWTVDHRMGGQLPTRWDSGRAATTVGVAVLVAVAGLLPFFIVAPGRMWHQIVGFLGIQHLQRLPFPVAPHTTDPNKVLERMIELIALAAAGLAVAWSVARRRLHPLLLLVVVGALYLLGRPDEFHLVPLTVAAAVVLAAAAGIERAPVMRVTLLATVGLLALHGLDRRADAVLHPPTLTAIRLPAADGVEAAIPDAAALLRLRGLLDRLLAPREPIFVADPRHDLVRVGDPLLYVLMDHPNPTRYDVMQPGIVTAAPVQREIVSELARTRVVVRWLAPTASAPEDDGAGHSSGVHVLDRFLAARFRERARFGDYAVLVRREPGYPPKRKRSRAPIAMMPSRQVIFLPSA